MESLNRYDICIITGGSSGIGLAMIDYLQKHCPQMAIFNLSRTAPQSTSGITHIACDLSSKESIEETLSKLHCSLQNIKGRLLLINNAGFGTYGSFEKNPLQNELNMIAVNVMAHVHLTHALMPEIISRKGTIINLSSAAAFKPIPQFATYCATKAFMLYWGLSLTDELEPRQVQVLTVCPKRVDSPFFAKADPQGERPAKRTPFCSKRVAEETFRALQEDQALLVFSAMDALRLAFMRPALAWKLIKRTTLFRES